MRHALAIVTVAVLAMTVFLQPAISQQDADQPAPVALYQQGMSAFEAGEYRQALDLFRRLDVQALPEQEQRINVYNALQAIDRRLNPEAVEQATGEPDQAEGASPAASEREQPADEAPAAAEGEAAADQSDQGPAQPAADEPADQPDQPRADETGEPSPDADAPAPADQAQPTQPAQPQPQPEPEPDPEQWLTQARRTADSDMDQAASLYQRVLTSDRADGALKRQAEAELAQLRRLQNPDRTAVVELIDAADQAIDQGEYRAARARLQAAQAADVELGWFDQQRLERQMAMVEQNLRPRQPQMAQRPQPEQPAQPQPQQPEPQQPEPQQAQPQQPGPPQPGQPNQPQPQPEQPQQDQPQPDQPQPAQPEQPGPMQPQEPGSGEQPEPQPQQPQPQQPQPQQPQPQQPQPQQPQPQQPQPQQPQPQQPQPQQPQQPEQPQPQQPRQPQQARPPQTQGGISEDVFQAARRAEAQQLSQQAARAMNNNNYELAVRRYEQALRYTPEDEQLQQQLSIAEAALAQGQRQPGLIQDQARLGDVRRQAALDRYRAAMDTAVREQQDNDFEAATDAIEQAKIVLEQNRTLLGQPRYQQLRRQANVVAARIADRRQTFEAQRQREAAERSRQAQIQQRRQARREQLIQIQRLLKRAQQLRKDMKYDQALERVNEALFIDETNLAAQAMQDLIQQSKIMKRSRELEREKAINRSEQLIKGQEATVPYDELIRYPDEWPQLSEQRLQSIEARGGEGEGNRRVRRALEQTLPIDFQNTELSQVINYFRESTQANFFVNWTALEEAGVAQDTPVTLQLQNVPATRALDLVLQQAGANAFGSIEYSVVDGVVQISSERDLQASTTTQVYDIRDLLVQVPSFSNAPEFDLRSALQSSGSGGGGGGVGGGGGGGQGEGLFGDEQDQQDEEATRSRAELITQIVDLITNTVGAPQDWGPGASSSVRELNGNLIIKTTSDNHRDVEQVLSQLRDTRAVQISVQARFLLVSDNFLENVGVDLDLSVPEDETGDNFGPIDIAQDSIGIGAEAATDATPVGLQPNGQPPGPFVPGQGFNETNRGLDLSASFMNDLEANLVVRATQADQRSLSLTAPRVTFFNGQRAYVIVARQVAFVSDLQPVPDSFGFDPTLSVISSGVVLDVEGTVSADRRYVTMTLRPSLAEIADIEPFEIGGTQFFDPTPGTPGGEQPFDSQQRIQVPELQLTAVKATVSVPDGGTLLLGGQRLVDEVETEAGVPVLSKVPVLNRLFTNTSSAKDERTLLILVRPNIIIQREIEGERFPGMPESMLGPQQR